MCYGGEDMGKTHTLLEHSRSDEGLLLRIVHELFRNLYWKKFSPERISEGLPSKTLEVIRIEFHSR